MGHCLSEPRGKSEAEDDVQQRDRKKAKTAGQAQRDPKPHSMSRKRFREEQEDNIERLRSHRARARLSDDTGEPEASFEAEPQLPGRSVYDILQRRKRRSEEIGDANSAKTGRKSQMHERDAIARLLKGGGVSAATRSLQDQ